MSSSLENVTLLQQNGSACEGKPATPSVSTPSSNPALGIPLSYIDFWPVCHSPAARASDAVFEKFDALVERANKWLHHFPEYEIISCETVDKKVVYSREIYNLSMYFTEECDESHSNVKGLRLWYSQRTAYTSEKQTLASQDVVPCHLNPGQKHPKYESMSILLDKLNSRLRQCPLQGRILTIQTVMIKVALEDWRGDVDALQCHWYDEYNTHKFFFLRVYYIVGPPVYETVGVQDFLPDVLDEGGIFHPAKYAPFSHLVTKANAWIKNTKGIRVTNVQTLDLKRCKKSENRGKRFDSDVTFEYRIEQRFRTFFLRVSFARPMDASTPVSSFVPHLTCHTFIPKKQGSKYQEITDVMERMITYLNETGARVFCVETAAIPEWMTQRELSEKGDRTLYDGDWFFVPDHDGNYKGPYRYPVIYMIRLYLDGQYKDPSIFRFPSVPYVENACCAIL